MLLAFVQVSVAGADELSDIKEQLQETQKRLAQLEEQQKQQSRQMEKMTSETIKNEQADVLPENLKWLEKIKISGDFRYRHDHTDLQAESAGRAEWQNGEERHRIRARLMFEAMINDDWDVAFRIASGSSKAPNSTNQDLEDAFSSKDIWLDLAYFDWHPEAKEGLNVFGGKMHNPFYRVNKAEHIWDTDLNPEGIAAQYMAPLSDRDQLFVAGGGFWVDESSSDVDTSLWGVQTYWKHTIGNPDYVLAGASYYDYGNLQGQEALDTWSTKKLFYGNTSSGGVYVSDYDIFEAFGEYGFKFAGMPLAFFGSWVQNIDASTDEDTGWLVGGKLNKAKDPGSWELGYDYRDTEADAVVGGFIESSFVAGSTDSRGHRFVFKYQINKATQAALTYCHAENAGSSSVDLDYRRLLADLVFKF